MAGMIRNAKQLFDHARNSLERPEVRFVPLGLRSLDQHSLQTAQLFLRELTLATGATRSPQSFAAVGLPETKPAAGALPTDTELACHLGLRKTLCEQSSGLDPPGLFRCVIHSSACFPFHVQKIPYSPSSVTSICEEQ